MAITDATLTVLKYFSPSRSPVFSIASATAVGIVLATVPATGPLVNWLLGDGALVDVPGRLDPQDLTVGYVSDPPLELKLKEVLPYPQYAIADEATSVWFAVVMPLFAIAFAAIPLSLGRSAYLASHASDPHVTPLTDETWEGQFNLSRAFCIVAPIVLFVLVLRQYDTETFSFGNPFFLVHYVACILQVSLFLVFMFVDARSATRYYNLIQFSLVTCVFLAGASVLNVSGASRRAARADVVNSLELFSEGQLGVERYFLIRPGVYIPRFPEREIPSYDEMPPAPPGSDDDIPRLPAPIDASASLVFVSSMQFDPMDELDFEFDATPVRADFSLDAANRLLGDRLEIVNAAYQSLSRQFVAMTFLYVLWTLCFLFWVGVFCRQAGLLNIWFFGSDSLTASAVSSGKQTSQVGDSGATVQ